jgi:uncharacterized protein (DUF2235 family)
MATRHVLCFDGTWNEPASRTNVRLLYEAARTIDDAPGVMGQLSWYHDGVGTHTGSLILGGAIGVGVSQNMLEGYIHLGREFRDGDQIFIIGFSRGAYTARGLSGLISKCGILFPQHVDNEQILVNAYLACKMRGPQARYADEFRDAYGRRAPIKFVGVWDTVGSLGLPGRFFQPLDEALFGFVDGQLASAVERGCHALAVDEHREDFRPSMWEGCAAWQSIEQRWFAGDHCDVGGSHERPAPDAPLPSDITLAWMLGQAVDAGLVIGPAAVPVNLAACIGTACHDAYKTFLNGAYARLNERYLRPIGEVSAGNETVDPSVYDRRTEDPTYRPANAGLRPL